MSAPQDIPQLVGKIDADRALAHEILTKLGGLVTSNGDVIFNLPGGDITVPSIPALQQALSGSNLPSRVGAAESQVTGLISAVARLQQKTGISEQSPFWRTFDLSDAENNDDADLENILFRAQIDQGLRLPFDGDTTRGVDRANSSVAAKLGDWMLPNHAEEVDARYTSAPSYATYINAHQYPINETRVYYYRRHYRWYYYGYYYRWWRYYYGYPYYTVSSYIRRDELKGAMTAQTFTVPNEKVLLGINLHCYQPGANKTAAKPKVVLAESAYGRPDLDNILATGTFVDNSNFNGTGSVAYKCRVDFDRPVLLDPAKSYSLVIMAESNFYLNYVSNQDRSGGVFYTQDSHAWEQDIQKDLAYELITADFGEGAGEVLIDMPTLDLSGGIASVKFGLSAQLPKGGEVNLLVSVNGRWRPVSDIDVLSSLPASTSVRLQVKGSRYAMPLIDSVSSNVTAIRPATKARYIAKPEPCSGTVKFAFEVAGFQDDIHSFTPTIKVDGEVMEPILLESKVSTDGLSRVVTAVFDPPASASEYQLDLIMETQTAAATFDINSITQLTA